MFVFVLFGSVLPHYDTNSFTDIRQKVGQGWKKKGMEEKSSSFSMTTCFYNSVL